VRAKVADFGLTRAVVPQMSGALDTWQWLAPEVIDTSGKRTYDTQGTDAINQPITPRVHIDSHIAK
jgi:hypothetical protein